MNTFENKAVTKFEMVIGKPVDGKITQSMLAGFAVQFEGESHYVIRLTMFPNNPYYLCKNKGSLDGYTVFAKVVRDTDTNAIRFQNPVGSGRLIQESKSHLEIRFPLIGTSVFMNLYPVS